MRYSDIHRRHADTHPFVAEVALDRAAYGDFERLMQDRPEIRLLRRIDDRPEIWVLQVGCASEAVRERLIDAWG